MASKGRPTILKDCKSLNIYLEKEQIDKIKESGMIISVFLRNLIDEKMDKFELYKELEELREEIKDLKKQIPEKKEREIIEW